MNSDAIKRTIWTMSAVMTCAFVVKADVIFYQGFDYGTSDGKLSTVGSNDWSTSSSLDADYIATGLEHAGSVKIGGSARTLAKWTGSGNNIDQVLSISLAEKDEFWVSVLISCDSATPGSSTGAEIALSVKENSWQGAVSHNVGKTWGNITGYVFSAGGVSSNITGAEFDTVETNIVRIVYHVKKSTVPEVWVDPQGEPSIGSGQSIGGTTHGNLTSIDRLRISFLGIVMSMDEFIVGDTYADVSVAQSPVPKKGTVILIN